MFSKFFNKKSRYIQEYTSSILTIDLEQGWAVDTDIKDPVTFYKEKDGKGALQFSIVTTKEKELPDTNELLRNNHNVANIKEYKEYQIRAWHVVEFEDSKDNLYNKSFYFLKPQILVYITYFGSYDSKESNEVEEVLNIVKSLEVNKKENH